MLPKKPRDQKGDSMSRNLRRWYTRRRSGHPHVLEPRQQRRRRTLPHPTHTAPERLEQPDVRRRRVNAYRILCFPEDLFAHASGDSSKCAVVIDVLEARNLFVCILPVVDGRCKISLTSLGSAVLDTLRVHNPVPVASPVAVIHPVAGLISIPTHQVQVVVEREVVDFRGWAPLLNCVGQVLI